MTERFKKVLVGMGFDAKDGHVRITKGENYRLFGGSEGTHEMMQEKSAKFNEQLSKRRKTLDDITNAEFKEIARKVGLNTGRNKKEG